MMQEQRLELEPGIGNLQRLGRYMVEEGYEAVHNFGGRVVFSKAELALSAVAPFAHIVSGERDCDHFALVTHYTRAKQFQEGVNRLGGVLGTMEYTFDYGHDAGYQILRALGVPGYDEIGRGGPNEGLLNVYLAPVGGELIRAAEGQFGRRERGPLTSAEMTNIICHPWFPLPAKLTPERLKQELSGNVRLNYLLDELYANLRFMSNRYRIAVI